MAGRPRKFDESKVVQSAMLCFWRKGFVQTSVSDLEASTGLNVRSIYNTFGDKERLFLRALEAYTQMASSILDQVFQEPGLEAIQTFFQNMSSPVEAESPANLGCLMVATVFEGVSEQPEVHQRITDYRAVFKDKFGRSLRAWNPKLEPQVVDSRVEYLLMALWGALTTIRMAKSTIAAQPMTEQVVQTVEQWR